MNYSFSSNNKGMLKKIWNKNKYGYLFLIPWIIGMLAFNLIPMITSLYISFTNNDLFSKSKFIGLQNYINIITKDGDFIKSLQVTFTYVFLGVPLQLFFALLLALVLNQRIKGVAIFRALYYIPSLLGGSVAVSLLWKNLFGMDGVINMLLEKVGFGDIAKISWVSDPKYAIYTLIILLAWQFGSPMIIFLSGLKQIPAELYESASTDGASKFYMLIHITLPMITPIIFFNLVMQIISAFKAFTPAFIVGGGNGGALNSILFYTLNLYKVAFNQFRMGYASSLAWILLLIIAAFTLILFKTSKNWVYYNN